MHSGRPSVLTPCYLLRAFGPATQTSMSYSEDSLLVSTDVHLNRTFQLQRRMFSPLVNLIKTYFPSSST